MYNVVHAWNQMIYVLKTTNIQNFTKIIILYHSIYVYFKKQFENKVQKYSKYINGYHCIMRSIITKKTQNLDRRPNNEAILKFIFRRAILRGVFPVLSGALGNSVADIIPF